MLVLNEELPIAPDCLYDILLERNAYFRGVLHTESEIRRDSKNQFTIFMKDGALAGWFSILPFHGQESRVQVYANSTLLDGLKIIKIITWSLLEIIKGKDLADSWLTNLPKDGLSGEVYMPVMIDLINLDNPKLLDLFGEKQGHSMNKTFKRRSGRPKDPTYEEAYQFMLDTDCSEDAAFGWWRNKYFPESKREYIEIRRNFHRVMRYKKSQKR